MTGRVRFGGGFIQAYRLGEFFFFFFKFAIVPCFQYFYGNVNDAMIFQEEKVTIFDIE